MTDIFNRCMCSFFRVCVCGGGGGGGCFAFNHYFGFVFTPRAGGRREKVCPGCKKP